MFLKFGLIGLLVFIDPRSSQIAGFILLLVILIAIRGQLRIQPHIYPSINAIQFKALFSVWVVAFCLFWFQTSPPYQIGNYIIMVICFIANTVFLLIWIGNLLFLVYAKYKEKSWIKGIVQKCPWLDTYLEDKQSTMCILLDDKVRRSLKSLSNMDQNSSFDLDDMLSLIKVEEKKTETNKVDGLKQITEGEADEFVTERRKDHRRTTIEESPSCLQRKEEQVSFDKIILEPAKSEDENEMFSLDNLDSKEQLPQSSSKKTEEVDNAIFGLGTDEEIPHSPTNKTEETDNIIFSLSE
jgi:hypothetical protein